MKLRQVEYMVPEVQVFDPSKSKTGRAQGTSAGLRSVICRLLVVEWEASTGCELTSAPDAFLATGGASSRDPPWREVPPCASS